MIPSKPQMYDAFMRNKIHGILSFGSFTQVISVGWPIMRLLGTLIFKAAAIVANTVEAALTNGNFN